jgi:excinuclease UvrABC nuclease subunit
MATKKTTPSKKTIPLDKNATKDLPSKTSAVYKIKTEKDKLLYIGETKDIKERIKQHAKNSPVKEVKGEKKVEIHKTKSKSEAKAVEKNLIKKLQPPHNKKGK